MTACRICGARSSSEHSEVHDPLTARKLEILLCARCGSMQHDQGLTPAELLGIDIYGDDASYANTCLKMGQRLFRDGPLVRHMTAGKVFNIEVNDGHFASAWIHRGWTVDGSSLSRISAERAMQLGVRTQEGDVSMAIDQMAGGPYDAIITNGGHCRFSSPRGEIRRAISHTNVGGAVFIHGPNPQSADLISGNHEYLNVLNQTIPSPMAFATMAKQEGLVLIERHDSGADVTLLYIKTGK